MGTWGTGISSNDTFGDVYAEFFDLYDEGKGVDEATEIVLRRNWEILQMPDAVNDLWFALAKAQWECKKLHPETYEKVRNIIESGNDISVWAELGATKSDLQKRKKVLDKFLARLESERPTARRRRKKVIRDPIFKKGDCLTYKLGNKNYGGAVVLEAEYGTELGLNLIAVTRINQLPKPSLEVFKNADVLVKNFAKWDSVPEIVWLYNYKPKEVTAIAEVVGTLHIEREFLSREEKYKYSFTSGWKMTLVDLPCLQFESEKKKPRPNLTIRVSSLIKQSLWDRFTSLF